MFFNKKEIKSIVLLVIILFLLLGNKALTYDNLIIHPKLSRRALDLYNNNFPKEKLTNEEINWVVEGAIAEDTDPRYLNHFYNPETGKGLSDGIFSGNSAKWWAYNQSSVSGDYSVPKILENYKEGNKKRAYQGVGHILHLIQDMSVPAHVRNDAHPEGDLFEEWLKQHSPISDDKLNFVKIDNIDEIFDELSKYAHDNFYSKDTLANINYKNYKIVKEFFSGIEKEYLINENNYKIVAIDRSGLIPLYEIDDFKVHFDYWRQLYPKAIGYSAGAIDYFQKEFKKIDEEGEEEKLGFWEKVKNSVVQKSSDLWDGTRYVLGDNVLLGKRGVDTVYKGGKDSYEKAKKYLGFYYDANKEIVLGVFDYGKEKSKEAINWTSDRFYQAYDNLSGWNKKVSDESEDKVNISDNPVVLSAQEEYEEHKNKIEKFAQGVFGTTDESVAHGLKESKEEVKREEAKVKFVYDGDTILLENGEKVRYIGMDTPELNKAGKEDDECLAWEARARNMELLSQGKVTLEKDPGVDRDKYGRLLRYVYVGDVFLNNILVREGLAEPFFCQPGWENCPLTQDKEREEMILNSYEYAQENNLGLFSSVCIFDKDRKVTKKEVIENEPENKKDKGSVENKSKEGRENEEEKINIHLFSNGNSSEESADDDKGIGQDNESSGVDQNNQEDEEGIDKEDYEDCEDNGDNEDGVGDEYSGVEEIVLPVVLSFYSYDIATNNQKYTSSTTIGLSLDIDNEEKVLSYLATTSPEKPDMKCESWSTNTPEYFKISTQAYENIVYLYLKYEREEGDLGVFRASSSIILKASTTAPSLTNLEEKDGVYWINNNNFNLSGEKDELVNKIIVKSEGTSTEFELATGTSWNIGYNFNFDCPTTSLRYLDRDWGNCPDLCEIIEKRGDLAGFLEDFHKKELVLSAEDIFGNVATTNKMIFKLDLSPPKVLMTAGYYSYTDNNILLTSGIKENFISLPFNPLGHNEVDTSSGVKNKIWEYKVGSQGNWQEADTSSVVLENYNFQRFQGNFGNDYFFRLLVEDYAGNVSSSSEEDMLEIKLATSSYPVISEIYANASTTDSGGEWIELYNPGNEDFSLAGYSIDTKTYSDDIVLPATSTILAHGFYLIGDDNWTPDDKNWPEPDYKETMTLNNSSGFIRLKDGEGREVDYVEYKALEDMESWERKAYINSTKDKMLPGGEHYNLGNLWDTDEFRDDFIKKDKGEPQNSLSDIEEWKF